jgi:23S rRNA pseudouridine2605 synthase
VAVNGRAVTLGRRVDQERDHITVDGAAIPVHPGLRYFALNKPPGVTTTLRDPHAARSLGSLIPSGPRVVPVGRLDRDSEGLLLLTNDGELAHRIQHPRYGIEKEYLAEVVGRMPPAVARALTRGVELEDGPARALRARVVESSGGRSAVSVVLGEGRKREVRRLLAAVGFPVRRLVRTRVGPVSLGSLKPGKSRPLGPEEVATLYRLTELGRATPR